MRPGVYYIPDVDRIVLLSKMRVYEYLKSNFVICCWENKDGIYPRTLIKKHQIKYFKYIGRL